MDGMTNKDGLHTGDKPCEYTFQRYIGQPVSYWVPGCKESRSGYITDIFPYYTYVQIGEDNIVAYPQSLRPLKPMPWLPDLTTWGATPKCDNCIGCDEARNGWVCGSWREKKECEVEQIQWRF